ncbi:MAG: Hydroxypyruvate isomerase [candidate division TA06 bacterium ADurb.Bin131]|uniref:Hydroxypyruvate isomerase n=1 Tax=candidate division TA06 bacterium ADurb.Bin131 TaxID=1852827 RepID=A0A1V6C925_UNCT6|nr:MAG: Hydroxypyruvate isomerase [candidate division TA06 bacterium ADurb.Bin131]HOC03203.1 TIM barrel protein [bacterium]
MVKIDVCIETVFPDMMPEEKIKKIKDIGYDCVEMWAVDRKNVSAIANSLKSSGVSLNNVVVNSTDGSNGSLVKREDRNLYLTRLQQVIDAAQKMDCKKAITCSGNSVQGLSDVEMKKSIIETLSCATEILEKKSFTLFLEPLNTYVDHKGYYLDSAKKAAEIIREINNPRVKLLYDIYHMQIMEGNLCSFIEKNIDIIGHFHSAGVPGRHELFNGEVNYQFIIKLLEQLKYSGYFGLEYMPLIPDHEVSLKKTLEYLKG